MKSSNRFASFCALALLLTGPAAIAGDHLANGTSAPGADSRDFGNPVAANPSGRSGAAAQPATVPGEGNPNAGADQRLPSVNPDLLNPNANPSFGR